MKTPFLVLVFSLSCAGPAFAADMPAFKPVGPAPAAAAAPVVHKEPTKAELQRRLDHAEDALEDFRDAHQTRMAWTPEERAEFNRLKARRDKAEERLELAEAGRPPAPIGPHRVAPRHEEHRNVVERDLDKSWRFLENAAAGVTEGVYDAFHAIKKGAEAAYVDSIDGARGVAHMRPLLFSNYIDVVKKGNQVSFIYCDSRAFKLNPEGGQHCEKLHAGSFSMNELKSCLATAGENKQPGMILNRQLADSMGADREFAVDHLKMFDSKENYGEYLNSCHARVAGRRPAPRPHAVAHVPMPQARPASAPPAPPAPVVNDVPAVQDLDVQSASMPTPTADGTL